MRNFHVMAWARVVLMVAGTSCFGATLTFDDNICSNSADGSGPVVSCPQGAAINQSYGDTATVNLTFTVTNPQGATASMSRWNGGGYSDLNHVGYGFFGSVLTTIDFVPVSGQQVTLSDFQLGSFTFSAANFDRTRNVTVTDLGTNQILFSSNVTIAAGAGSVATLVSPGVSSTAGLRLSWDGDSSVIGIDNVNYSSAEVVSSGVPEPATFGLLGAALGGLVLAKRRSK